LQLAPFLGFRLQNNYSEKKNMFNLREGNFSEENLIGMEHINADISFYFSELLKAIHPNDLREIKMNHKTRSAILKIMETFYAWHVPDFGSMKTLNVLSEIL
jgi:DNA repair protein RecO (recombination protein O)